MHPSFHVPTATGTNAADALARRKANGFGGQVQTVVATRVGSVAPGFLAGRGSVLGTFCGHFDWGMLSWHSRQTKLTGLPASRLHLSHVSVLPGDFVASGSHIADDSVLVHAGAGLSSHATSLRLAMALLLRRVLTTIAGTLDLACSSVWRFFGTTLATSHALLDPSPSFHTSFGIHLVLGGCQLLASTLSPFRLGFPSFRRRFHSKESTPICIQRLLRSRGGRQHVSTSPLAPPSRRQLLPPEIHRLT
ncbi:hypothetical protein PsorP6_011040 [Peronosclerospora sorghi]|uniref:Uncharacterized protein n=1 Tax=Peronosclerospora sorghi TaxID=230839 RepID=A0ACC0VV85_9STRA|nr:hypothetical protein PsorP6_011040 [Peronosclerospora sorghi]